MYNPTTLFIINDISERITAPIREQGRAAKNNNAELFRLKRDFHKAYVTYYEKGPEAL
jgi:hypothetical protein